MTAVNWRPSSAASPGRGRPVLPRLDEQTNSALGSLTIRAREFSDPHLRRSARAVSATRTLSSLSPRRSVRAVATSPGVLSPGRFRSVTVRHPDVRSSPARTSADDSRPPVRWRSGSGRFAAVQHPAFCPRSPPESPSGWHGDQPGTPAREWSSEEVLKWLATKARPIRRRVRFWNG